MNSPSQLFTFNEAATPKPEVPGVKPRLGLSDAERQQIVSALITDASLLTDGELSPARQKATSYFLGQDFGNEEPGRSQVILTEVRDTVLATIPDILRVFFAPEQAVEFAPTRAETVATAEQATDYVQYVFAQDNPGFERAYDVAMDGLVRKIGVMKWAWEKGRATTHEEDDADHDRVFAIASIEGVHVVSIRENPSENERKRVAARDTEEQPEDEQPEDGPFGHEADLSPSASPEPPEAESEDEEVPEAEKTFTIIYKTHAEGRARLYSVPPEEFIFARNTRQLDGALFVGHRREMRRGDLLAMGIDAEDLAEHGDRDARLDSNIELVARQQNQTQGIQRDPAAGPANDEIVYCEGYFLLDDGEGERELRQICTIGPGHYIVSDIPCDEVPFAVFTPIPEPHILIGQSQADLTMDIQLAKSSIARGMLDSLALSIFPRVGFVEGQVSVEDLMNTEIGAPIRMKKEGMIQPITHPFTGEAAMPILTYFDDVVESRTGRNKGAMGLDADALQSSTKQAVNAAVSASQAQKEMLCRFFAEQVMKPLFRGIYRMLVKHCTKDRIVKLRGSYTAVNPSHWDDDCDVVVNVALGTSLTEQKIAFLEGTAARQEQVLQMLGPDNPLCTVAQLRNTYARIAELAGYKDATQFWKVVPPNWTPPPAPQPPPSPEQINAQTQLQIEQMRTDKDLQIKEAELNLKMAQQKFEQELEIRKMAMDFTLRRYQIDAQFKATYSEQDLESDARANEAALEGVLKLHSQANDAADAAHSRALDTQDQAHRQGLERDAQAHDQAMAERAAAAQEAAATAGPEDTEQ